MRWELERERGKQGKVFILFATIHRPTIRWILLAIAPHLMKSENVCTSLRNNAAFSAFEAGPKILRDTHSYSIPLRAMESFECYLTCLFSRRVAVM